MEPDLWSLYALMLRSRAYEEAIASLWEEGLISGEMHLGTGEEAIAAGVVDQLEEDDAMALDHRGTGPLLMRGVEPVSILRELLGEPDGLCGGQGGHMHLYAKDMLSASSGIVGASGPAGAGFALAAQQLRPGSVSVAFFGEGALNQGMFMEALNLAAVWRLPVLFVCKDDDWAITTDSAGVTAGGVERRVRGFDLRYRRVDGRDVDQVWNSAHDLIAAVRSGDGPAFLHARCVHLEAHFLGFQMLRVIREPISELPDLAGPLTRSFLSPAGAPIAQRVAGLRKVLGAVFSTLRDPRHDPASDPLLRAREQLEGDPRRLRDIEESVTDEVTAALKAALAGGTV